MQQVKKTYSYFVLQVLTGLEGRFITAAHRHLPGDEGRLIWPRRAMIIRKGGVKRETLQSLYPGYLFFETEQFSGKGIMTLKKSPGFIQFLKSDRDITPLDDRERRAFLDLISFGEILYKSTVIFDENDRIRVVDGPLSRFEGNICRVDRRKGRATVVLSLQGRTLKADLSFDTLEAVPEWEPGSVSAATFVA